MRARACRVTSGRSAPSLRRVLAPHRLRGMPAVVRLRNLTDAQLFDRQSRKLRGFTNTGLRNLHDCLRDHFRQGVVAILDAESVQTPARKPL
jgi:hypothetical protein